MILVGDCIAMLKTLPAQSVHCVVTSPPYWNLRDYQCEGQLGQERSPQEFIDNMVEVFQEVRRVLRNDGTLWVNIGDTYCNAKGTAKNPGGGVGPNQCFHSDHKDAGAIPLWRPNKSDAESWGIKGKDLVGIPWMLAFALRSDGWYLRSEIIWNKPNPMPESVEDRPSKSHEQIFLLTKSERYFFDQEAVRLPPSGITGGTVFGGYRKGAELREQGIRTHGRECTTEDRDRYAATGANIRTVWTVTTQPFPQAHFATFPPKLIEPCILAGTSERGCCPGCGAPWRRVVEKRKSFESGSGRSGNGIAGKNGHKCQGGGDTGDIRKGPVLTTQTTGWQPGCNCIAGDPVPCTVLDPFGGAGTTGLVAAKLGRKYVLCELNPEYAAMAEARIRNRNSVGTAIEPAKSQLPLFTEQP